MSSQPDLSPPTETAEAFESAYLQLQQLIARLEDGRLGLEDALRLYDEGLVLAERCDRIVQKAELRLTQLPSAGDGQPANLTDAPAETAF
jgi:exodeoxyribonuclease VII small subunit